MLSFFWKKGIVLSKHLRLYTTLKYAQNKIYDFSKLLYYNIRYFEKDVSGINGAYAFVNLDHRLKQDDHSRYFYTICMYLDYAGFKVVVKASWRDFRHYAALFDFKKSILKQNYRFVRKCSTPSNSIVLVQPNLINHTIHLSYGYTVTQSGQYDCLINYPIHPDQVRFCSKPLLLEELRGAKRTMKIFFAGDTNKIKYASIKIRTFFDVMPRPQVIECITSEFAGRIKFLENESDKPEFEKILAAQGNTNDIVISQIKTKEENWLRILSKSDFFICPPGVFIPLCHNCIEAMSVGAIPILEYNDMFYPHLEHLVNCLQFSNADELQAVVEKALAMTQAEIDCMRKNVLNYYDEHLSVINIKNKIRAFSRSDQHQLKLAIPFVATEEEWKDYVKACRHLFGRWIVDE